MNTAKRPPLARLAASVALALLVAGATLTASLPSLAGTTPQPMITEVQPVDGLLRISGFHFAGTATAITLGGRVLRVVAATSTGVDAVLPETAPGTYLLTLTVGSGGSLRNDESWVAIGALGPQGPAGANGAIGPQGPAGPAGATGQQGLAGSNGLQGMTGAQGAPGAQGATGMAGPVGAAGATGPIGPVGPQGPGAAAGFLTFEVSSAPTLVGFLDNGLTVTVNCPAGSVVSGGGYSTSRGASVETSRMSGNGWTVHAFTMQLLGQHSFTAFAVCLQPL